MVDLSLDLNEQAFFPRDHYHRPVQKLYGPAYGDVSAIWFTFHIFFFMSWIVSRKRMYRTLRGN